MSDDKEDEYNRRLKIALSMMQPSVHQELTYEEAEQQSQSLHDELNLLYAKRGKINAEIRELLKLSRSLNETILQLKPMVKL
jgi:hypothetical protein